MLHCVVPAQAIVLLYPRCTPLDGTVPSFLVDILKNLINPDAARKESTLPTYLMDQSVSLACRVPAHTKHKQPE